MEAELMEYPDYSPEKLASYLKRARALEVDSIFTNILSSGDLSNEDKNKFIQMYCALFPDFMRQMRASHDHPFHHPTSSREVEHVPYYDPDEPTQYQRPARPPSTLIVNEGGKSRRRSNRKSRRKNRNFP